MRKLLEVTFIRCKLKSTEILRKKWIINEFSILRRSIRSRITNKSGTCSLSFSHGIAILCYLWRHEYLHVCYVFLLTSRSFQRPSARWRHRYLFSLISFFLLIYRKYTLRIFIYYTFYIYFYVFICYKYILHILHIFLNYFIFYM